MDLTFPLRRYFLHTQRLSVPKIKEQYPFLFTQEQVCELPIKHVLSIPSQNGLPIPSQNKLPILIQNRLDILSQNGSDIPIEKILFTHTEAECSRNQRAIPILIYPGTS